jgi:histone acetyltransferase (RNA polymerase elongator complex component)
MAKTHYIIPIFVPELACPNRCVFCNQYTITAKRVAPSPIDTDYMISKRLSQIPSTAQHIEVAFFGGNFTGIEQQAQIEYLQIANTYLNNHDIHSIRVSTRPDYINYSNLEILNKYGVKTIELGVQSMNDSILQKAQRGHTSQNVIDAVDMIKSKSFRLGLQMMIGLPDDNIDNVIHTADEIIRLQADETRIYPLLVIKDTLLHKMYLEKKYIPLALNEAVWQVASIARKFEQANTNILRIGLHPSKDFFDGETLVAGPWHPAFKQLVYSQIWKEELCQYFHDKHKSNILIEVGSLQLPNAIGYKRSNVLQASNKNIRFTINKDLKGLNYVCHYC